MIKATIGLDENFTKCKTSALLFDLLFDIMMDRELFVDVFVDVQNFLNYDICTGVKSYRVQKVERMLFIELLN